MHDERYKLLPLHRRNGTVRDWTVVDGDLYDALSEFRWHRNNNGYAARAGGGGAMVLMHRSVLGLVAGDGLEGDHINRDKLDNRRENLRVCTHATNNANTAGGHAPSSRHRGVYWDKEKRRWRAKVRVDGRYRHLGYFEDEDEAGAAVRRLLSF